MTQIIHKATYQGYPVQALQFARRPGLLPDFGFVDLDIADFVKLEIKNANAVPWVGRFGAMANMEAFILAEGRRTVALGPPPLADTPGQGFLPLGDLILQTLEVDPSGTERLIEEVRYSDIYLAAGGMEEITDDLDDATRHNRGVWRVPITDIRTFWNYGAMAQTINGKLDGAQFDPATLNNGAPWTAPEVFRFLVSQLPGGLSIDPDSELFRLGLPPPENVVGDMSPAVDVLAKLLSRYSLELSLLPFNRVAIYRKNGQRLNRGEFFATPAAKREVDRLPLGLSYERKSVTLSHRPPVVTVTGKRRVRKVEMLYVPIYQDQDQRFYRLDTLPSRWNMKDEDIRKGALIGHEKQFRYVVDKIKGGIFDPAEKGKFFRTAGTTFNERLRILQKWAYKGYGPAVAFRDVGDRGITRKELERMPFLPAVEYGEKFGPGVDDIRIRPPLVRAYTMRQGFFEGRERFKDGKKIPAFTELDQAIDAHLKKMRQDRQELEQVALQLQQQASDSLTALASFGSWLRSGITAAERAELISKGLAVQVGLDFSSEAFFGLSEITVRPADVARANNAYRELKDKLTRLNTKNDEIEQARAAEDGARTQLRRIYGKLGGLAGWVNMPYGEVPDGEYTLDPATGVLLFSEPVGVMAEPFVLDREQTTIAADGHVVVHFGYEIRSNSAYDWTSVSFMDSGGSLAVVEGCSPASIHTMLEHDPDLRLYERTDGVPVNGSQVITQAATRARAALEPRSTEGYIYQLPGFVGGAAIAGEFQYMYDGDLAETFVTVNAPNARLPRGSVRIKGESVPATLRIREVVGP